MKVMDNRKNGEKIKEDKMPAFFQYIASIIMITFDINLLFNAIEPQAIIYNVVLILPLYGLFLIIFRNHVIANIIITVVLYGIFYLNEYVCSARQFPIQFCDFYCVSEAFRVASSYRLPINQKIILNFIILICILILVLYIQKKYLSVHSKKIISLCGCIITFISLCTDAALILLPFETPCLMFDMNNFVSLYGLPCAIMYEYKSSEVKIPDGYSVEKADQIITGNTLTKKEHNTDENTDIIVIMNEALTDYTLLGDIKLTNDPLKNFHEYNKNCIKGKMAVSVFGGNTCNTEFEFLTGASLSFLPAECIPYLQYMHKDIPSFAKDVKIMNYGLTAIHPYIGMEWRRITNYPLLGFEEYISGEKFSELYKPYNLKNLTKPGLDKVDFGEDLEYVRGFISDRECYNKILDQLDDEDDNFVFAVTIQNHGGYDEVDDFQSGNFVSDENSGLNQYLSLLDISDKSFKEFTDKLEKRDKRTIVLMFGDHQPGLDASTYIQYNEDDGLEDEKYTVPYIMWANYDVNWEKHDYISANYLSAVLKKNAGLELNEWDRIRLKAMEEYPALSSHYCVDNDLEIFAPETAISSQAVYDYYLVQYKYIFDSN